MASSNSAGLHDSNFYLDQLRSPAAMLAVVAATTVTLLGTWVPDSTTEIARTYAEVVVVGLALLFGLYRVNLSRKHHAAALAAKKLSCTLDVPCDQEQKTEPCWDSAEPCWDFKWGRCKMGDRCRYSHDIKQANRKDRLDAPPKKVPEWRSNEGKETKELQAALTVATREGEIEKAEAIFKKLCDMGTMTAVHHTWLLNAYVRAGYVYAAETLINSNHFKPDAKCIGILMTAYAKSGKRATAELWMDKMTELGIEPNLLCYNSVIDACARCGEAHRAMQWLQQMRTEGQAPSVVSYSCVLHAYVVGGELTLAEELLQKMSDRQTEVDPNTVCYNCVIHGHAKALNSSRCAYWIDQMEKTGVKPSQNTYNGIIDLLGKHGDADAAETWLDKMCEAGFTPESENYNAVFGRMNDPQKASALFIRMCQRGITPP